MPRREFSRAVKREALQRSGGFCEASGAMYGLEDGRRCNAPLSAGVEFDHLISDSSGGEPTLENCVCACRVCHAHKTAKIDTPKAAKIKRVQDKHLGVSKPKHRWPSRPFSRLYQSNTKYINADLEDSD